ncbi:uncharacterized protein MONBRDRAFT_29375 [Monosiga brevicollis MX1]|uniref:Major facilitator superfamily (MFS) profile domain-containing protein n=1 Tax=Monosiga brevicollis TaxID=81824 RepID=A9VAW9_MONBE|nr:uncharacterized protein MONBRDRAFT_29375 [Monosiga brevicollis MX1]EDQ85289.1 predicted protein [Monosiga brevicollis MX1]|eukprot:XP_001749910.1 hypothetical protein [Monosiga brevicollis MX1]
MSWLILPKVLYMLYFGGTGAVFAFLPVFFKDAKHLTYTHVGLAGMAIPFAKFAAAPVLSGIADKLRIHRAMLIGCVLASLVLRVSLLFMNDFPRIILTIVAAESFGSVGGPIFENGVLELLPDKSMYGRQRLFGAIGFGTAVLVSGLAVTHAHVFWPMFANQGVLWVLFLALSTRLALPSDPGFRSRHDKVFPQDEETADSAHDQRPDAIEMASATDQDDTKADARIDNAPTASTGKQPAPQQAALIEILHVMTKDAYTTIFFLTIALSGFGAGIIDNYLFIYIEELGGTKTIQGMARFVMCAAEVPMFWYSGAIFDRLGTTGCLVVTFCAFIVRFLIYAFMSNPWLVVASEPLHGLTFAVMWTAATRQAFAIAPQGLGTTMQGIVSGLHFGLGSGMGALVGGFVYESKGAFSTFMLAVGTASSSLVLLLIAEWTRWRKNRCNGFNPAAAGGRQRTRNGYVELHGT